MPDRFYDGQRGPDIRRELNNLEAVFDDAIANAKGPQGWSPVVAVVTDSARRVLQITDWTGGEGSKPTVTGFIGATGIVATAALAVDIRGSIGATGPSNTLAIGTVTSAASPSATITGAPPNQTLNLVLPKGDKGDTGNTGPANTLTIGTVTTGDASATITGAAPSQVLNLVVPQGIQGIQGNAGWSPIFATVVDGERRVLQLVDWTGGTGSKPATGEYVGTTGLVATIAQAVDIRGPSGVGTGNVNPTGTIDANDLAAFADSTGEVIKALKAADLPISTATQTALNGKAPLNGAGTGGTWPISTTGNAATATKLVTARTINGTAFDGSANISVSVDWASVTGKPAVIAAGADAAAARTAIGAGTSNLADAPSDGKTYGRKNAAWSEVASGATLRMTQEVLTSGTSWTAPANLVGGKVKYDVVGAGAAGSKNGSNTIRGKPGAPGAYCSGIATVVAGNSYSYTIGAPGTPTGAGGTSAAGAEGGATTMFGATANGGPETPTGIMSTGAVWGGATATGATLNIPGAGLVAVNATVVAQTGNTPFGISPTSITTGGIGYGIGGLGSSTTLAGTDGTSGVIVLEYLVSI